MGIGTQIIQYGLGGSFLEEKLIKFFLIHVKLRRQEQHTQNKEGTMQDGL